MFSSDESSHDSSSFKKRTPINYSINNDKGSVCHNCHEIFPDFDTILGHKCRPFKCSICMQQFVYDYQEKIHKCGSKNAKETELNSFQCSFCQSVFGSLSSLELHDTSCFKKKEQCNRIQPNLFYSDDASYSSGQDKVINSKSKLSDISVMESKKRKRNNLNSSLEVQSKVNKCPSNASNSRSPSNLPAKKALHFSGKFRNSKRIKNKLSSKVDKTCNDNATKGKSETKELSKSLNGEVPEEETCNVTAESSDNILFNDIMPETNPNEKVNDGEMSLKSNFKEPKDAASVTVVLSKLPTVKLLEENKAENKKKSKKEMAKTDMFIMKKFAKKLKVTLESTSNVTFNDIHSSHSSGQKIKPQKKSQANASKKNVKRRKTNKKTQKKTGAATNLQTSEKKDDGIAFINPLKEFSSDKRKTKQSRSNSKEHDSGLESFETSSTCSSISLKSAVSETKSFNRISSTKVESSVQVFPSKHSQQKKYKKTNARKRSIINQSNNVLVKETNCTPLELVVSESTLNDIPDDIHSRRYHPRVKDYNKRIKMPFTTKIKTENDAELGDLLCYLPPQSGILLKAPPGSFHSFRCPKCNKLFKHLRTGSKHLVSCRILKFKKNFTVPCNEVIYVCTACHFNCTRKLDLTRHKVSCTPNSITDILFNYDGSRKGFLCPRCCFSCLSQQTYDRHSCTKRLEEMQTCIVNVEKLNTNEFMLKYESGGNTYNQNMALLFNKSQACVRREKKNIIRNAETCDTLNDVLENVVKPVIQCNEIFEPENELPDFNLNVSMPYEQQKMLAHYAETVLSNDMDDKKFFDGKESIDDVEFFKILKEDEDYDSTNIDVQNDELVINLRNHKCHCNKEMTDAETSSTHKNPCLTCLTKFVETVLDDDPDLNLKMPVECKENSNNNLNYSIYTPSEISSSSSVLCNIASTSNDPRLLNAEMQLKTVSSSAVSYRNGSTSFDDPLSNVASNINVLPSNSEIIMSNKFQVDDDIRACINEIIANCDNTDISDDTTTCDSCVSPGNNENDHEPGVSQIENLEESDLSTSDVLPLQTEVFRKDKITMILFHTEDKAEVYTNELKLIVTPGGASELNLRCKQFQALLFDLYATLQVTILALEDNTDDFLKVLNYICEEELDVEIVNNSVNLHIPYLIEDMTKISAYVIKENGIGTCEKCGEMFKFPILIKHVVQEHKKTDIYLSIT